MTMNAKRLSCGVLSGWLLTTAFAHAQAVHVGRAVQVSASIVSQSSSAGTRREADELLRRARVAMKDGDLTQARWYLDRLEKMDVNYDGLFQRFADTPAKLRRDLEKLDGTLADSAPVAAKPSELPERLGQEAQPLPAPVPMSAGQVVQNPFATQPPGAAPVPGPLRGVDSVEPPDLAVKGRAAAAPANTSAADKTQALQLLATAQAALGRGEIQRAEQLALQARDLNVPDSAFGPGEDRPWMLLLQIDRAKRQQLGVVQAAQPAPASGQVRQAVVTPYDDDPARSLVRPASVAEPLGEDRLAQRIGSSVQEDSPPPPFPSVDAVQADNVGRSDGGNASEAYDLMRRGEEAVKSRDLKRARELFAQAWKYEQDLDPVARQRLQDNLQLLRVPTETDELPAPEMSVAEQNAVRRFSAEVSRDQVAIGRQLRNSPKQAWEDLKRLQAKVQDAEIPESAREQLLGASSEVSRKRKTSSN